MLLRHLQSSLQQAPEINSGLREMESRAAALGKITDEATLLSAVELLYASVPGSKTRSVRVRHVMHDMAKAKSLQKAIIEEDFV